MRSNRFYFHFDWFAKQMEESCCSNKDGFEFEKAEFDFAYKLTFKVYIWNHTLVYNLKVNQVWFTVKTKFISNSTIKGDRFELHEPFRRSLLLHWRGRWHKTSRKQLQKQNDHRWSHIPNDSKSLWNVYWIRSSNIDFNTRSMRSRDRWIQKLVVIIEKSFKRLSP